MANSGKITTGSTPRLLQDGKKNKSSNEYDVECMMCGVKMNARDIDKHNCPTDDCN